MIDVVRSHDDDVTPVTPPASTNVLDVRDLSVRFGPVRAVTDVSFQVRRGEFFGIVGESGSGKSVTARALMRLLPGHADVAATRLELLDEDLLAASPRRMRQLRGSTVSMVFQDALAALDPVYTVGQQLIEAVRAHHDVSRDEGRERAVALLAEVGIRSPERAVDAYPHQLSGGMRQRVVIASALIADPELIIADEPTTALDVTVQKQILQLLRRIQEQRGTSVILITHDLGVVAETSDRVAVFYGGIVVEEAPVVDLFTRPNHPYTASLLRSMPRLGQTGRFEPIPGSPIRVLGELDRCPFEPRCPIAYDPCREGVPAEIHVGDRRHRCLRPGEMTP